MEMQPLSVNKNLDRFLQTVYERFILGNIKP
jgi:hypothetical protein